MVWRFLITITLLCNSLYSFTVFESISFYNEMIKRVNASDKAIIEKLIKSEVYKEALDSRNIAILRQLESKGIIRSWAKHETLLKAFLDEQLLQKSDHYLSSL